MMSDKNITCPVCSMSLYRDGAVILCENIACNYSDTPNNSQTEPLPSEATDKNGLREKLKTALVAFGIMKWIVLGVIAVTGTTIGLPAIFSSPTLDVPHEQPVYTPALPATPGVAHPSPTSPATTSIQESNSLVQTSLTGITNGVQWEYVGYVLNGSFHGNGRQEFENGSWFDGQWSNGNFINGRGMYICQSGDWFLGDYIDGYWAFGSLRMYPSGATYEGEFTYRNGRHYRHGNGRLDFPNGDYYDGGWSYDQRHGQGVSFHFGTGSRQSGVWISNIFQQ